MSPHERAEVESACEQIHRFLQWLGLGRDVAAPCDPFAAKPEATTRREASA